MNIKQLDVPSETNEPIVVSKICEEEEEESYTLQEMVSKEFNKIHYNTTFN